MATLSEDDVRRIAALAHLALTPEEVALFSRQLAEILDYVRTVQAQDTTGIAPTSHAMGRNDGERADEPTPELSRRAALANAPEAALEAGLFKVPRVVG